MHIAVGGLFDLLKAPVSTRDQNGDKYDDRGKAEVKLCEILSLLNMMSILNIAVPWLA
ncbi:hypothetical protein HG619_22810 [Pseudomonas syringae]|nr:hypothetical protein [Pseudomonas syringae]